MWRYEQNYLETVKIGVLKSKTFEGAGRILRHVGCEGTPYALSKWVDLSNSEVGSAHSIAALNDTGL